jgi:hypothetical protein
MVVIHFSENNCGVTCTEAGIKTHIISKNTPLGVPGLKISNCF